MEEREIIINSLQDGEVPLELLYTGMEACDHISDSEKDIEMVEKIQRRLREQLNPLKIPALRDLINYI